MNLFTRLLTLGLMLLMMSSCVQQRDDIEQQGANIDDLFVQSRYDGLTCELTTSDKKLSTIAKVSQAEEFEVNHPEIKYLDVYQFSTDCPFLGENQRELEFRGQPNTTYKIVFRVEPNFLVAYKTISDEQVSHLEKPYSTKQGDKWVVPVGGFAITNFFNVEKQRNADNRDTNIELKVKVDRRRYKHASYFEIDTRQFQEFDEAEKIDVVPSDFFKGEWYFQRTVVRKRYGSGSTIGFGSSGAVDHGGNFIDAGRIEFVVRQNNIFGVSTNIDEKLKQQMLDSGDRLNAIIPVTIPGELVDYRREDKGDTFGLSEMEVIPEVEKGQFFKMDILDIQSLEDVAGDFLLSFLQFSSNKELKSLKIQDDYFEFVIEKGGALNGEVVRYAFMRTDDSEQFQPRFALIEDMKKYGYFTSTKHQIFDERTARLEDIEKRTFISRFNPNKDIVYHFSTATPKDEWVRNVGREAINLWQQAFEKAGLGINIVLDESADQEIGDLRYNLLNIITDDTGDNGGFGPSFNEASTGEVISAVSNIYTAGDRNLFFSALRAYVAEEMGYQPDFFNPGGTSTVSPLIQRVNMAVGSSLIRVNDQGNFETLPVYQWKNKGNQTGFIKAPVVADEEISGQSIINPLGQKEELNSFHDLYARINPLLASDNVWGPEVESAYHNNTRASYVYANGVMEQSGIMIGLSASSAFAENTNSQERIYDKAMVDFAQEKCPTVMNFIDKYKNSQNLPSTAEENEALWPCVQELMALQALGNMVHEIGHNLGLRHNFMGSVDEENFTDASTYRTQYMTLDNPFTGRVGTSSCMDYVPWPAYTQVYPGNYDIAALKFGYKGKVETASGEAPLEVPNGVTIDQEAQATNTELKDYKFCTDLNARLIKSDPYCAVHDFGTNAVEMVKFVADKDLRDVGRYIYRFDKARYQDQVVTLRSYSRMKEFYDEWRAIVASQVGVKKRYLEGVSAEEYEGIVEGLINGANAERNRDLLKARNIFINVALDLAFLPNKYCMVQDESGENFLFELASIKKELLVGNKRGEIRSCQDPLVVGMIEESGFTLNEELGYFLEGGRFSLDPRGLLEPLDFAGTSILKLSSMLFMTSRGLTPSLFNQIETNFTPNVIDEPDARMVITSLLMSRFLDGVFLTDTKIDLDEYAQARTLGEEDIRARLGETKAFKNFKDESDILIAMYSEFLRGLFVPGDSTASARRFSPFMVRTTNDFSIIENAGAVYHEFQAGQYLYASQRNQISVILINKLKELQRMPAIAQQTSGPFPEETFVQAKGALVENFGPMVQNSENMNFGDFFMRVIRVNSLINQLQGNPQTQPIAQLVSTVFSVELGLFFENILPNQLTPFLEQLGTEFNQETVQLIAGLTEKDETYEPANELEGALLNVLKQPMSSLLPEDSDIELISSKEQLEAKIDTSISELEEQYISNKEVGEMYLANQEELDAQMDLVFRLLLTAAEL